MRWPKCACGIGLAAVLLCAGCPSKVKKGEIVPGEADALASSKAFRNTVAEVAWIEGMRRMRVRGYGVVAGLGDRGSAECPRRVRERLLQEMYKMAVFARAGGKDLPITPEQILDDRDTAVVVVVGEIPAAAQVGQRFDLTVRALSGTQTVSLEGGRLYDCNLRIYRDTEGGMSLEGRVLARGSGPIFVNPWSDADEAATRADPRRGLVLGGGITLKNRRVRLVLERPSYQGAAAVAQCINARFPKRKKVADAVSPAHVQLRIPPRLAHRPRHFLELVRHLYLPKRPGFLDQRIVELAEELGKPQAPHADIALAFEGIGRSALATVQTLYTDERDYTSFYAALAGLRLGDNSAAQAIAVHAWRPGGRFQLAAVEALRESADLLETDYVLRELLDSPDPRVRVRAYRALAKRGDELIASTELKGGNFTLDVVPSTQPNLVFATRTGEQRIALIGKKITCRPPLFFSDKEGFITLAAELGDQHLTLLRKTPFSDRVSPPLSAALGVGDLVVMLSDDPEVEDGRLVRGLGVPYSLVVRALADLCKEGRINADFLLEQATIPELFGPQRDSGRGESDL